MSTIIPGITEYTEEVQDALRRLLAIQVNGGARYSFEWRQDITQFVVPDGIEVIAGILTGAGIDDAQTTETTEGDLIEGSREYRLYDNVEGVYVVVDSNAEIFVKKVVEFVMTDMKVD